MTSNRKLVFLDLDDTLLSSDKTVTMENCRALREALAAGHGIVIASGRSVTGGRRIMGNLGLDAPGCYLLAFHGSVLYDCGRREILRQDGLSGEEAAELLRAFGEEGIYAHTFSEKGILSPGDCPQLRRYNRSAREQIFFMRDLSELEGRRFPKVIAIEYEHPEKLQAFREKYAGAEEGRWNSFFSNRHLLEYCRLGCNKGSGLIRLAELLGVPLEDTIAVGDEENDLSMIRAAGIGAAMQNARPEVKEAADYVTRADQDHSGVAEVLERFLL